MARLVVTFPVSLDFNGASYNITSLPFSPCEESRSRVRRCLFGPRSAEDAFAAQQAAIVELSKQSQNDSSRWNFDFANDKPLPGHFTWVPYRHESKESKPGKIETPTAALRQSHITDFLRPAKRSTTCPGKPATTRDAKRSRLGSRNHVAL